MPSPNPSRPARRSLRFALVALLGASGASAPAVAGPFPVVRPFSLPPRASTLPEGEPTLAPLAFVRFCLRQPDQCVGDGADRITLDEAAIGDLSDVNRSVNRSIRPQRKLASAGIGNWEIAPAAGDCNDYALTKRHELLARGYPASALLLSVVETRWGEGHLVLTVRTDRGDLVLDNLSAAIRPWDATGYRWIKRQSSQDPNRWVAVDLPGRTDPGVQL